MSEIRVDVSEWIRANGPGGWIDDLRKHLDEARELLTQSRAFDYSYGDRNQPDWYERRDKWLERVRDLIAAEGELGDAKSDLAKRDEVLRVALKMLEFAQLFYIKRHSEKTGSIETPYDKAITAIQSCLNTTSEGEK
jgi:hypothetical protein